MHVAKLAQRKQVYTLNCSLCSADWLLEYLKMMVLTSTKPVNQNFNPSSLCHCSPFLNILYVLLHVAFPVEELLSIVLNMPCLTPDLNRLETESNE